MENLCKYYCGIFNENPPKLEEELVVFIPLCLLYGIETKIDFLGFSSKNKRILAYNICDLECIDPPSAFLKLIDHKLSNIEYSLTKSFISDSSKVELLNRKEKLEKFLFKCKKRKNLENELNTESPKKARTIVIDLVDD